jgi:AraC-like DNA-binding protein
MTVARYVNDNSFKIYQPLFRNAMENYEQRMVFSPSQIFFYHFHMPASYPEESALICVPDGCVDIIFVYGGNRCVVEVIGSTLSRKALKPCPGQDYFGLRLKPGMFMPIGGLCLADVTDRELFMAPDSGLERFAESLAGLASLDGKISLFLDCFGHTLTESQLPDPVQFLLWRVNAERGSISIGQLATEMSYSERQVRRLLYGAMGLGPKTLCRIMRFQNALHFIMNDGRTPIDLDRVFMLNYADQPHFQREFKEFTGMPPRRFLEEYRKSAK